VAATTANITESNHSLKADLWVGFFVSGDFMMTSLNIDQLILGMVCKYMDVEILVPQNQVLACSYIENDKTIEFHYF
jgi:hypothetical protein